MEGLGGRDWSAAVWLQSDRPIRRLPAGVSRLLLVETDSRDNQILCVQAKGFELGYLEKVVEVKDTVHRQSLLHHTCSLVVENYPESSDVYSEIPAISRSAKVRLCSSDCLLLLLFLSALRSPASCLWPRSSGGL